MDPFAMIDLRAFGSLWYWVLMTLVLVHVSQRGLGVPRALVLRARQGDARARAELVALAHVRARAIRQAYDESGTLLVALWSAALTALAVLGFGFWFELAQALFLLALPLAAEQAVGLVTAPALVAETDPERVRRLLNRHLFAAHAIAFAVLFCAVFWGMLFTLMSRVL